MPSFNPAREWKHQTTTNSRAHGEPVGVDLFDDEQEGMTTIYVRHADGTRYPARDVTMGDKAKEILEAWQTRGQTRDYRTTYKGVHFLETPMAFAEWIAKVETTLRESKILERSDVPDDIWRQRHIAGMRPSKAAAIAIDEHLAALKFKHV